jgi:hypothetical protein
MGTAVPQSKDGELLGHVRDIGAVDDPKTGCAEKKQDFHVDVVRHRGPAVPEGAPRAAARRCRLMTVYKHIVATRLTW